MVVTLFGRRFFSGGTRFLVIGATVGGVLALNGCTLLEDANFSVEDEVAEKLKLANEVPASSSSVVEFTYPTSSTVILSNADAGNQTFTGTCEDSTGTVFIQATDGTAQTTSATAPCMGGVFSAFMNLSAFVEGSVVVVASLRDASGNTLGSATAVLPVLDFTVPVVTGIYRHSPSGPLTHASIVTYRVEFNRDVTGLVASELVTQAPASFNPAVLAPTPVAGDSSQYLVQVVTGHNDLEGDLVLNLSDHDLITDSVGHKLGDTGVGNGNFGGGETYHVDGVPPIHSITNPILSPATAVATAATQITTTVSFADSNGISSSNLTPNDIVLPKTGSADCQVGSISLLAPGLYSVSLQNCSGAGQIGIGISADVAFDNAGNGNEATPNVVAFSKAFAVDAEAPSAPTLTSPSCGAPPCLVGPALTISGACETSATVSVTFDNLASGPAGGAAATGSCVSGSYSIQTTLHPTAGEPRTIYVSQTDTAGNSSSDATVDVDVSFLFRQIPEELPGFSDLPSNQVLSVFRDTSTQKLYAATPQGLGIFDGTSWTTKARITGLETNRITHVSASGNHVLVGTPRGLAHSSNGGSTFAVPSGLGGVEIRDLFVSGSNVAVATDQGAFISNDSGATFDLLVPSTNIVGSNVTAVTGDGTYFYFATNQGVEIFDYTNYWSDPATVTSPYSSNPTSIQSLAYAAPFSAPSPRMFAVVNSGYLHTSDDEGYSFDPLGSPAPSAQLFSRVSALGQNIALSGGFGVYYSINRGDDFPYQLITGSPTHDAQFSTLGSTQQLDVATDQGVLTWSKATLPFTAASYTPSTTASGLPNPMVQAVVHDGTKLYVGTQNGVAISTNSGVSFSHVLSGSDVRDLAVSGSLVYAATSAGLKVSTDGGATFANDPDSGVNTQDLTSVSISDNGTVLVGLTSSLKTKPAGAGGFGNLLTGITVTSLHSQGSRVCVGTASHGLYRSTNSGGGVTQEHTQDWLNNSGAVPITRVFCGQNRTYVGTPEGLFIRNESTSTWSHITPASGKSSWVLGIHEVGDHVYVSTQSTYTASSLQQGAVWISTNGGQSFNYLGNSEGIPYTASSSPNEGEINLTRIIVEQGNIFIGSMGGLLKTVSP